MLCRYVGDESNFCRWCVGLYISDAQQSAYTEGFSDYVGMGSWSCLVFSMCVYARHKSCDTLTHTRHESSIQAHITYSEHLPSNCLLLHLRTLSQLTIQTVAAVKSIYLWNHRVECIYALFDAVNNRSKCFSMNCKKGLNILEYDIEVVYRSAVMVSSRE